MPLRSKQGVAQGARRAKEKTAGGTEGRPETATQGMEAEATSRGVEAEAVRVGFGILGCGSGFCDATA